jgi:hypothetical protein
MFEARALRYRAVRGLLQEYYLGFSSAGEHGAVYRWLSEEALREFRESELECERRPHGRQTAYGWRSPPPNGDGEPRLFRIPVDGGTPVLLVKEYSTDASGLGFERTLSSIRARMWARTSR